MTSLRRLAVALLSKGVISPGRYSILTGLALLLVGIGLASISLSTDPVAGVVGLVFFLGGLWQFERGLRSELHRRR